MIGFLKHLLPPPPDEQVLGETIYLRPPRITDWRVWAELRGISRDFLAPWEPTWPSDALSRAAYRRRLRHYIESWRKQTGYTFFIFRRSDDALLGGIGLTNIRRGITQSGTLGYWIGKTYARQGIMTEALRCVLSFAFGNLDLHRVEAACLPANAASRGLLEKCGFRQEGYATEYLKINGVWSDHALFAKLREDAVSAARKPGAVKDAVKDMEDARGGVARAANWHPKRRRLSADSGGAGRQPGVGSEEA